MLKRDLRAAGLKWEDEHLIFDAVKNVDAWQDVSMSMPIYHIKSA